MPTDVNPPLSVVVGYPRLTLTPHMTRVSVPAIHGYDRNIFATAALIIRADLERQSGTINQRWKGMPRVADDGKIKIVLTDRNFRRRYRITVTPAEIAAHLRDRATA